MNYKHKKSLIEDTTPYKMDRYKSFIKWIDWHGEEYYFRETGNIIDIIIGKRQFIFHKKNSNYKKFQNGFFLYNQVKQDAVNFLNTKKLRLPKKYPSQKLNSKFKKLKYRITATDLNHAYWRIAYQLGIISERTYLNGIKSEKYKISRLTALSTLGKEKVWECRGGAKKSKKIKKLVGDEQLRNLYEAIRLKCYWHMNKIRKLLGEDFVAYRTDCIYYTDTKANRKKVQAYCDKYDLYYKQLVGDKKHALYKEDVQSPKLKQSK